MVERPKPSELEQYFVDPGSGDPVLRPGATGPTVRNLRLAMMLLGYLRPSHLFDNELSDAGRQFQMANGHQARDGLVGPGTRALHEFSI